LGELPIMEIEFIPVFNHQGTTSV